MVLFDESKLVKYLAARNAIIRAADKVAKDGVAGSKAELDGLSRKVNNAAKDIGEDYEGAIFTAPTAW
jgi:hypothetical protein